MLKKLDEYIEYQSKYLNFESKLKEAPRIEKIYI